MFRKNFFSKTAEISDMDWAQHRYYDDSEFEKKPQKDSKNFDNRRTMFIIDHTGGISRYENIFPTINFAKVYEGGNFFFANISYRHPLLQKVVTQ